VRDELAGGRSESRPPASRGTDLCENGLGAALLHTGDRAEQLNLDFDLEARHLLRTSYPGLFEIALELKSLSDFMFDVYSSFSASPAIKQPVP
jgi:hypothetical protein